MYCLFLFHTLTYSINLFIWKIKQQIIWKIKQQRVQKQQVSKMIQVAFG